MLLRAHYDEHGSTMSTAAQRIGFDRFIQLDWLALATQVRSGKASSGDLEDALVAAGLGEEARSKTRTKLNGLCLAPQRDVAAFIERGAAMAGESEPLSLSAFAWGAAVVAYSFFGKVAELTGRLTSLHGSCSSLDVHRRMSETYGDREVVKRATQAVLQTQADWGALERIEGGTQIVRRPPAEVSDEAAVAWLVEAALHYGGKALPISVLQGLAVLYPFRLDQSLAYAASISSNLELRSEGNGSQMVALRQV
jgi:hypothetical protein